MRILHVIDSGGMYGAEVMLINLAREQQRRGDSPMIASIGTPGEKEKPLEHAALEDGIPCAPFRMIAGPNLTGTAKILRFAHKGRFDLLHSHGYKGNILLGFLPRLVRRLPIVTTVHGWTSVAGNFTRMRLYEWLDTISLPRMDAVIVVSEQMLQHQRLRRRNLAALYVVDNGIDPRVPHGKPCREEKGLGTTDRVNVLAVGRLSPEKGFDLLIRAVGRLRSKGMDIHLTLFGEGGLRSTLQKMIGELGLAEYVQMPGFTSDAASLFHCYDVLVMPSLTEGLPITLLEAMRGEIAVIASRVGGIPEALSGGRGGILVEPGDIDELEQAVRIMGEQPALRARFSLYAKKTFLAAYSASRMADEYNSIYSKVCGVR
jgi:glycosyltransferase involved in cell wall biosynthesis